VLTQKQSSMETAAVAIQWEDKDEVPFISAIGQGLDAHTILSVAIAAKVPILENPLLMQELCELRNNDNVPSELYMVVAQILAFVKFMEERVGSGGP